MPSSSPYISPLLLILFVLACSSYACSQPGQFDSSFDGNGSAFTGTPADQFFAHTSTLQPDGKLIVAGESYTSFEHACLARYNVNGSLDAGFGIGGKVKTDFLKDVDRYSTLVILKNGKIVAGGSNGYSGMEQFGILARYNTNGTLDSTFGTLGKAIFDFASGPTSSATISSVQELPNGVLKVIGGRRLSSSVFPKQIVVHVKPSGLIDSSLGVNGIGDLVIDPRGIRVGWQQDGKSIFAATRDIEGVNHFEVSRYSVDGALDLTFNNKGSITTAFGKLGGYLSGAVVLPNDKILVYGTALRFSDMFNNNNGTDLALLQYNANGTLDTSFGANGIIRVTFKEFYLLTRLLLQADGKILVAGTTDDGPFQFEDLYTLARFQSNGRLDSTFADQGKKIYNVFPGMEGTCREMHLSKNRIYLTGWSNYMQAATFAVLAIQNDGIPLAPTPIILCSEVANTSISSDMIGSVFQWQMRQENAGFVNIENDEFHSGVATSKLIFVNLPRGSHGHQYRCVTDKGTSNIFTLQFENSWTGAKNHFWNDAGNWSCGQVPGETSNVVIDFGPVLITTPSRINSLKIKEGVACTVTAGASLNIKSQ